MGKQANKGSKKGWKKLQTKKYAKTGELLSDVNDQETKQQAIASSKNDELFVVEKAVKKNTDPEVTEAEIRNINQKRKEGLQKQLKRGGNLFSLNVVTPGKEHIKPLGNPKIQHHKPLIHDTEAFQIQREGQKLKEIEKKEALRLKNAERTKKREEKKAEAAMDIWADEVVVPAGEQTEIKQVGAPNKKRPKKRELARLPNLIPHGGQSYNPRQEDYQQALQLAYKQELDLEMKKERIIDHFTLDPEADYYKTGGDDVMDGFTARERPDEPTDPELLPGDDDNKKKRKKRNTKTRKMTLMLHRRQWAKHLRRIRSKTAMGVQGVEGIVAELDKRATKNAKLKDLRKVLHARRAREARMLPAVSGARDVFLPDELPEDGRLSNLQNGSYFLWNDTLRAMHKSGLHTVKSMKRGNIRVDNWVVA